MIYGIGTDLINSERVEKLLNKFGEKFLFKVFSLFSNSISALFVY